ncbi:MAG: hypothetical protein U5M23_03895 [Marinagarivorans sp.]|nr:hypothetical protein [Marinagarivorans sp.]
MIPIDPFRPVTPIKPFKITRVQPAEVDVHIDDETESERRRRRERRHAPFRHRGGFEQRTGRDRRDSVHIDIEV